MQKKSHKRITLYCMLLDIIKMLKLKAKSVVEEDSLMIIEKHLNKLVGLQTVKD